MTNIRANSVSQIDDGTPSAQGSITIENVSKSYGETEVLSNVSLSIGSGSFVTLLGPSGCGKTTLLRLIAGFIEPSRGQISIDGQNVNGIPTQKRPIGMVFQNLALFPHFTVYENIAYGLKLRQISSKEIEFRVGQFIELVGLQGLGERRIAQLSGGQKQRVALARSLVLEPSILLLDEPLSALDLQLRKQLQFSLKDIQKVLKTTFVFVTHDQEEATLMSDQVVVMSAGEVQQIGSPQSIYERPETLFVSKFIGEVNELAGTVRTIKGDMLEIDTAIGLISLPKSTAHGLVAVEGAPCVVCLRPEKLMTLPTGSSAAAGRISFDGVVEDRLALGPMIRNTVRCKNLKLISLTMTGNDANSLHAGDHCSVQFDAENVQLFSPLTGDLALAFGERE